MTKAVTLSETGIEKRFFDAKTKSRGGQTIYLVNGVKLEGKIVEIGDLGLVLEREGVQQLVFFHAMSTVT